MPEFSEVPRDEADSEETEHELSLIALALNAASDSIIIHRTDGTLVRFNRAAAEQAGLTAEEFRNLPPWGWAQPLPDEVRQERLDALRARGENEFLASVTLPDGTHALRDVRTRWVEAPGGPYVVAVVRDVTEQMQARAVLENLAFHDPLTGLANRALFEDRLDIAMSSARRHNELLGVAFLDLDDFKSVNDEHGHIVGDQVLIAVAQRLENSVRQEDTVARLGGDEFAVILPRFASVDDLELLSAKLLERIAEPIAIGEARFDLTASAGLAVFEPDDDARSLLMRADIDMYEAKRTSPTSRGAVMRRRGWRIDS